MAKRVIWSFRARNDRQTILEYWHDRNGNKDYSSKLAEGFRETVQNLKEFVGSTCRPGLS